MNKKFVVFICSLIVLLLPFSTACGGQTERRTRYEISLSLDKNVITATQTVDYVNDTENSLKELKFNLFANAFRKDVKHSPISAQNKSLAYPNGVSYGDMQILSAKTDGVAAEFSVGGEDENVLSVKLNREVFPQESIKIDLEYSVNLANVIARTGINDKTINLANFYPILCVYDDGGFYECVYYSSGDPFYSDCADYKVSLTCDSDYVVAATGSRENGYTTESKTTHEFSAENVRSFAMVLSKDFETATDNTLGIEVNYYYYKDAAPLKSLEYAIKSLKHFSDKFGAYPYSTYSVVQTPFVQGGMEFPTLVMIADNLEEKAYGEVIVHETAHQWWQTSVGNNEIEYGFLDEGLAEYSVVLFYENHPEYKMTREFMVKSAEQTYKVFCTVSDKVFGKVNTKMIRSLKDFESEYEYVNIAYVKPCIMYDNLRTTVGDERFFKGLKKYFEEYKYKNATPDDLVGCFEKIGAGTNGFFESFFDGKVII